MSLTGAFFGWVLVLLTLGGFVAAVWFWPRLGAPRVGPVAARAGVLVGVNLLVLLTAAVQLNDQFLFFADWSDLHGALTGTIATTGLHGGGSAQHAAGVAVPGPAAGAGSDVLAPLPPGSRVQDGVTSYKVTGPLSGITADVLVTVPVGYRPADAATRYPVLETFSGYPGSPAQWVKTMHLQSVVAQQVAAHRLGPILAVSPQLQIPAGNDTECVNGPGNDPQVETWLTRDVPDWVAAHFRVSAGRGSWATIGLSAGGWCAAMAAMLHPAQYGGAIVMAGYFHPDFGATYDPFPPHSDAARRYDLVALVKRSPPPLALWVQTSHADPLSYASSAAVLKAARSPLSVSTVVLQNAGHRMSIWQNLLPTALAWLGSSLPGFHAR